MYVFIAGVDIIKHKRTPYYKDMQITTHTHTNMVVIFFNTAF